jgi:hypothetical protein
MEMLPVIYTWHAKAARENHTPYMPCAAGRLTYPRDAFSIFEKAGACWLARFLTSAWASHGTGEPHEILQTKNRLSAGLNQA